MSKPKPYAAVIRWNDPADSDGIEVIEYFHTIQEAEAFIAKQRHDSAYYEWEVMKYD